MINLNIMPIHYEGLNCFSNCIISYLEWSKIKYEVIFSKQWGFEIEKGNKVILPIKSMYHLLREYIGIDFLYHKDIKKISLLN